MHSSIFLVPILAGLLRAETIVIEAGNLYFKPMNVNASVGDVLEFHFLPNNHSVVMGDINDPCKPAASGGFYSGFLPVEDGEAAQVFQVTINDTNPMVYYCSQNASDHNHCKKGMLGFVNQVNQTAIGSYQAAASELDINISPEGDAFGGVLAANPNATASANSTSSADGTSATSTETASSGTTKESGTATSASASASETGTDSSGAEAMSVGSGVLALIMALMAA